MGAKKRFYVVWKGHEPGVYDSWDACRRQIEGFQGAVYKGFASREAAEAAFEKESFHSIGKDFRRIEFERNPELIKEIGLPETRSIAVDAACSGNPGIMEYRGVFVDTGTELFRKGPFRQATQNIGEFLALVHAMAYMEKHNFSMPVYSDSTIAIKWVKEKRVKTKLEKTQENEALFHLIDRALIWLKSHDLPGEILKWKTEYWGEIPADFGRK